MSSSANVGMERGIPKRIIQFWIGERHRHSLRTEAVVSNIRLLHPDYEYLFFDNAMVEEFVEQEFPQYGETFRSFRYPIQRCDFFRYLAIYRYGGFYLDLDVLLASNLSPLLEKDCVFSFERLGISLYLRDRFGMDWQVANYAFGAVPGHPFIKAIIENCVRGQKDPNWVKPMMRGTPPLGKDLFFVINSTGPGLVSRTLAENSKLGETVTILLPNDVCDPANWKCFGAYGIHLGDNSWQGRGGNFLRERVAGYWWRWIDHRRLKESRELGRLRQHPRTSSPSEGTAAG